MTEENTTTEQVEIPLEAVTQPQSGGESQPTTPQESQETETVSKKDFNKAYYQRKEAERQLADSNQEADGLRQRVAELESAKPTDQSEPTLEQCDYDESRYIKALVDHRVNIGLKANAEQTQKDTAKEAQQKTIDTFLGKRAVYAAENPEYAEVVNRAANAGIQLQPDAMGAIVESEHGLEVHQKILSDPVLIEQINSMTPVQAVLQIGRLEASLNKPAKKVTSAPDPIQSPIGGGGVNTDADDPLAAGTVEEYCDRMNARERAAFNAR